MAIYAPQPAITRLESDLLILLAKIVLDENSVSYDGNVGSDRLVLSDERARELCDLLTEYIGSRAFVRGTTFVEMMFDGRLDHDHDAREIYLSSRKDMGRTRVLASRQWADFKARIGLEASPYEARVRPMDSSQFIEMEKRLLRKLAVHPALEKLIESLVIDRIEIFDKIEKREKIFVPGQIRGAAVKFVSQLQGACGGVDISKTQVVGIATVVSDATVMFSTRDWGVAGTLSTIAGGLAMSAPQPKA
ncbi:MULTISPECIES: hypothetical protein [Brevundimonas]|uniref:hypothetical protein n=1 Tax=Brevundimonas TaxID=41275 RepID=UPI000ACCD25A|nr:MULTISPECIES: hypothetical protein [Brevundimonas]